MYFYKSDVKKPLMGELQETQGILSLPANAPSQAIVDVSENMRAKIYALFCKIGMLNVNKSFKPFIFMQYMLNRYVYSQFN